jgi:multiple sugar transport system substrate-binding protein
MTIRLKGMTWSHPRGYDPLVATAELWEQMSGVQISWEKRSLQDFESYPVADLARAYDLIVIDHPHVGQITEEGCLAPLDVAKFHAEATLLLHQSVGGSFESYNWQGRQWALPIDTATQVMAWRPDLLPHAPREWSQVLELARAGRVLLPLRPPHSLMVFMTLCAHLGEPCGGKKLIDDVIGTQSLEMMSELASLLAPDNFSMDPIAALDVLGSDQSRYCVSPYLYGYVSYAKTGFRDHILRFRDIPVVNNRMPVGATLGGTGIAVSALSAHRNEAMAHAYWLSSAEVQRGIYAQSGGQPANTVAWEDEETNQASGSFYRETRSTLDGSYIRPRFPNYMKFQTEASTRLTQFLQSRTSPAAMLNDLDELYCRVRQS